MRNEITFANSQDVPLFDVFVDSAERNNFLPADLARHRVISWDWDDIASAVDQMMTEGKNF